MNKRYFCVLACLMCIAGCGDDGDSGKSKVCDPLCGADETCVDGTCKKTPVIKDCDPACGSDETCVDGACKKTSDLRDCDPACGTDETCVDGTCRKNVPPESTCDPACEDGQTCVEGRCAICIGDECFFAGGDEECKVDSDCEEGHYCEEGECKKREIVCEPACGEKEKCIEGKCVSDSLLWTLCNNQADCAGGTCLYYLTPSRELVMEVNGEEKVFDSENPISVSYLDDRINAENYNAMHPSSNVAASVSVGICSYECTKEGEKTCPEDWSCQIVAKGKSLYPENVTLPVVLSESDLNKTPFAAICRPDITPEAFADTSLSSALCSNSKDECDKAGLVYYHGMCLEACDTRDTCPLMFGCESVEVDGGESKVCLPVAGSCTSCYDNDGDGAGYGHCTVTGVDCDDDNPNAYYTKKLKCDELIGDDGKSLNGDLNCNGLIDRFEMVGTVDNCMGCGVSCKKPQTDSMTVTCEAKNQELSADWRLTASSDMTLPEFECVEQCAFGYGDCNGNAKCTTELLTSSARQVSKDADYHIFASDLKSGVVYAKDADGDGYPRVDNVYSATMQSEEHNGVAFDVDNSLICCANDTKYCYTANAEWKTRSLDSVTEEVEDENGETRTIKYTSPVDHEGCTGANPACYDSDDLDVEINPEAVEKCDGRDNDGSQILLNESAVSCEEWCSDEANDCSSFSSEEGGRTVYAVNGDCDATPEGSKEPELWLDVITREKIEYGDKCTKYHESGEPCNENGKVVCAEAPTVRCAAGDKNCSCGKDENGLAYIINETNTIVDESGNVSLDIDPTDYVKYADADYHVTSCHCDNSLCTGDDCEGKDGRGCFELCGRMCQLDAKYALSCYAETDGTVSDGISSSGALEFDGKDQNCNGTADEDAWLPCIITGNARYEDLKNGTTKFEYYTDETAGNYKLPENDDGSVNLCRIGILKGVLEKQQYVPKCFPLYEPREYDFYGDSFDSNCDGADYDYKHTVFVSPVAQGTIQGDENNTCRYMENGSVNPCGTLNGAIKKAYAGSENKSFYYDILVKGGTVAVGEKDMEGVSSPVEVPALQTVSMLQKFYTLDASSLSDKKGHIKSGHFVSAYAFHSHIVDLKRKKSTFDVSKYLFTYDDETCESNVLEERCTYEPAVKSERNQPGEVLRIYGGFSRGAVGAGQLKTLPVDNDIWISGESASTKLEWNVQLKEGQKVYSYMVLAPNSSANAQLSLRLSKLELEMNTTSKLSSSFKDGVTFVGINGAAFGGTKDLILNDTIITVKGAEGYSFPFGSGNGATNGVSGVVADTRNASRDENDKSGDNQAYINQYISNREGSTSYRCGYGLWGGILSQSMGGYGGYSKTERSGGYSKYSTGKPSVKPNVKSGYSVDERAFAKVADGGKKKSSDHLEDGGCDDDKSCENEASECMGKDGVGGANGANGTKDKVKMSFEVSEKEGLMVTSDRSQGRGQYGIPGAGGGGGTVFHCWKGNGSDHTHCYGASGGNGGCGGQGGEAGGTGGSALGIVVKSVGVAAGSTRVVIKNSNKNVEGNINVANGSGGMAQAGGKGGNGANGGGAYMYAREGAFSADTQCQRMARGGAGGGGGAGGVGAGGKAGWAYPIVAVCPSSFKVSNDKFKLSDLNTLSNCGFEFEKTLLESPEKYGVQTLEGTAYADTPNSNRVGGTGVRAGNKTCGPDQGGAGQSTDTPSTETEKDKSCLNSANDKAVYVSTTIL